MKITLMVCVVVSIGLISAQSNRGSRRTSNKRKPSKWNFVREMHSNLTKLWDQVQTLSNPVQINVHGIEGAEQGQVDTKQSTGHHGNVQGGNQVHIHFNLPYPKNSVDGMEKENEMEASNFYTYARCDLTENVHFKSHHKTQGYILLRQKPSEELEISVNLTGFNVNIRHPLNKGPPPYYFGFHVHQYGDLSRGCNSFGGHFNPDNKTHGGPRAATRHAGDWGNVMADTEGNVLGKKADKHATLFGTNSIIGRGIVIHAGPDDLGKGGLKASLVTGNAGGRLACCVIGRSPAVDW